MEGQEKFTLLLTRFFINVDTQGLVTLSSTALYSDQKIGETQTVLNQIIKIAESKLIITGAFKYDIMEIRSDIKKIQSVEDIDKVVSQINQILVHCKIFKPVNYSTFETFQDMMNGLNKAA